jgi:hypothetical protein
VVGQSSQIRRPAALRRSPYIGAPEGCVDPFIVHRWLPVSDGAIPDWRLFQAVFVIPENSFVGLTFGFIRAWAPSNSSEMEKPTIDRDWAV